MTTAVCVLLTVHPARRQWFDVGRRSVQSVEHVRPVQEAESVSFVPQMIQNHKLLVETVTCVARDISSHTHNRAASQNTRENKLALNGYIKGTPAAGAKWFRPSSFKGTPAAVKTHGFKGNQAAVKAHGAKVLSPSVKGTPAVKHTAPRCSGLSLYSLSRAPGSCLSRATNPDPC